MNQLRPEFRAGLDKLTKYILDRAGPKQLGSITLTGPMFAGLTQSFLDAINSGAVPAIANSWQVDLHPNTHILSNLLGRTASHFGSHCRGLCVVSMAILLQNFELF